LIEGVLAVLSTSVDVNPVSAVILAMNSLATLAFISLVTLVLFGFSANFHVFDGVTDRTLESYAQRLTINIIDALNSTSTASALSAKQEVVCSIRVCI
jgi:hypothetical protein